MIGVNILLAAVMELGIAPIANDCPSKELADRARFLFNENRLNDYSFSYLTDNECREFIAMIYGMRNTNEKALLVEEIISRLESIHIQDNAPGKDCRRWIESRAALIESLELFEKQFPGEDDLVYRYCSYIGTIKEIPFSRQKMYKSPQNDKEREEKRRHQQLMLLNSEIKGYRDRAMSAFEPYLRRKAETMNEAELAVLTNSIANLLHASPQETDRRITKVIKPIKERMARERVSVDCHYERLTGDCHFDSLADIIRKNAHYGLRKEQALDVLLEEGVRMFDCRRNANGVNEDAIQPLVLWARISREQEDRFQIKYLEVRGLDALLKLLQERKQTGSLADEDFRKIWNQINYSRLLMDPIEYVQ